MQDANFENISVEELLTNAEYLILANPEMAGVEITDSEGRTWFLQLVEGVNGEIN